MKIIGTLLDIFLENRERKSPSFLPLDLTEHYRKELGDISIDAIYVATKYSEIEQSIARYKYSSERENVDLFVDLLSKLIQKYEIQLEDNILLVPVPMHWSRYFMRGFDHMNYIAKYLSKNLWLPFQKILSTKWSRHQSKLSREKRLENKKNSFRMRDHDFSQEVVVIIDDVISSWSTANECARVLKSQGVKKVIGIFLASNL